MGRPTKLTDELKAACLAYVQDYEMHNHAVPSVAGMAVVVGVARGTLYRWASENTEFKDILDAVNEMQEFQALNGGLTNTFNAQIVKLLLGKHGYHDKVDSDLKSSDGSMTPKTMDASALSDNTLEELMRARRAESDK